MPMPMKNQIIKTLFLSLLMTVMFTDNAVSASEISGTLTPTLSGGALNGNISGSVTNSGSELFGVIETTMGNTSVITGVVTAGSSGSSGGGGGGGSSGGGRRQLALLTSNNGTVTGPNFYGLLFDQSQPVSSPFSGSFLTDNVNSESEITSEVISQAVPEPDDTLDGQIALAGDDENDQLAAVGTLSGISWSVWIAILFALIVIASLVYSLTRRTEEEN